VLKRIPTVLILLLALSLTAVVPATAAEAPVGTRVNIVVGVPATLPADTAFHVLHGWGIQTNLVTGVGAADFRLDVDGIELGAGKLVNTTPAPGIVSKLWLYNFEDGLPAGPHVLTGHWFLPCEPAVASGLYGGICETPNAPVEVITISLPITFT